MYQILLLLKSMGLVYEVVSPLQVFGKEGEVTTALDVETAAVVHEAEDVRLTRRRIGGLLSWKLHQEGGGHLQEPGVQGVLHLYHQPQPG